MGFGWHRGGGGADVYLGPRNTARPEITGVPVAGEELTASTGAWTGTGTVTYTYQWVRNGDPIDGATSAEYTLVEADVGAIITVIVTATDDLGSRSQSSLGLLIDDSWILLTEDGDELLLTEDGDPILLSEAE